MAITKEKIKKWAKKGKLEKLIKALQTNRGSVRWDITDAIGEIGNDEAIDTLGKLLGDNDSSVRNQAVKALVKIGSPAVDTLIKCLSDNNVEARKWAVHALTNIGDPKAIESLFKSLDDSDKQVREWAVVALFQMGPQAVDHLINTLDKYDEDVRKKAAQVLYKRKDPRAIDFLIRDLEDNKERVRYDAINALAKMPDIRAVDPLIRLLEDEDECIVSYAESALVKIGALAVDSLIKALDSNNSSLRSNVVSILDDFKWKPAADETGIKFYIIKEKLETFVDIGAGAVVQGDSGKDFLKKTIESLVNILEEEQSSIRKKAAGILDKFGWQPTSDETGAKYHIARGNIEKCIKIGAAAVGPLIRVMTDKDSGVRDDASAALVKIGAPAVDPLINALNDEDKDVRLRIIETLAKINTPRAVDPLINTLGDDDRDVCIAVFEALKKLYQLKSLSQEKKKTILKLKGNKIADHHDHTDDYFYREHGCDLPMVHTDKPEIYFNL
jgi:HEAT repeat protein